MSYTVHEMEIHGYSDIGKMESEIARLLMCDQGREPACLETLSCMKFR